MGGPISPKEAKTGKHIPEEVFEAFNELIREGGYVKQKDVVERIVQKMNAKVFGKALPPFTRDEIFKRGWLDVEDAYRKKGWDVKYDKPGYNESYEAFFVFTERRK